MPRLRKLRRKQKYRYDVNRKRLNQKMKKLPDIKCDAVKKAWDHSKSANENMASMGIVMDPNEMKGLKIPTGKQTMKKAMLPPKKFGEESSSEDEADLPVKNHVVVQLEKDAKDGFAAKTARPLPKGMFKKLTVYLDKYGEDYEAMVNDTLLNFNQETAAQLESQVRRLKSIPQQWVPYLKSRGLVEPPPPQQMDAADIAD